MLVPQAPPLIGLEDLHRPEGGHSLHGRHGSGEDETIGVTPHHVYQLRRAGNIPTSDTKGLPESARDDIQMVHDVVSLSYPRPSLPIETNSVDFIDERQGVILMSHVANLLDGGDVTGHGVDRLKGDNLGHAGVVLTHQAFEVGGVVVSEYLLLGAAVSDPHDHGVVVSRVGEDDTPRDHLAQSGEGCVIGHIAGAEDEGGLLLVEVC